jgi:hypothetical protein
MMPAPTGREYSGGAEGALRRFPDEADELLRMKKK